MQKDWCQKYRNTDLWKKMTKVHGDGDVGQLWAANGDVDPDWMNYIYDVRGVYF